MLVLLCACAYLSAGAAAPAPALQGASRWSVASSVLLSDAAATGGELGYRLQAALTLRAQPLEGGLLLHFTLESPQLMLRGKHRNAEFLPKPSLWDSMPSSEFLAVWSEGHITEAFLDPADPPDVLDYKKALISLFQFQVEEGERNETDVSGSCHVHYDAVSELVFRKSKMQCTWQGAVDEEEEDGCAERRRVVRYRLTSAGLLDTITADEVLLLRGTDRTHALKARALHTLSRAGAPAPAPASPPTLAAARERLPALQPTPLPLELRPESDDEPKESLWSALAAHRAAVSEARAGSAQAAAATLALLPAVRAATAAELTALLGHPDTDELEGLVRVLGLSGSRGAHLAARETLQLQAKDPPREHLGREYLAALALAPEVDEFVIRDAMRLGAAGGALAPAALLAAAAAAHGAPEAGREALAKDIKNSLTRTLSKCKEDACSAARLLALGQLRRPELAELLLEHAETGAPASARAAIAALRAVAQQGYYGGRRRRLEAIALGLGRRRPLDVRAAALELVVLSAADRPLALLELTSGLRERGPRELRRLCWLRLRQLAETRPELAALLPSLDPRPRDWLRRAHDGTSSVLERAAHWARLDSWQLAGAGVLSRGKVELAAHTPAEQIHLLTVEIWTRGMESFATPPAIPGAAREAEDELQPEEEEPVEGGLALTVGGVRRPDVTLFNGQGELLGHIWSGAGSSPTAVLRAVLPRGHVTHHYALQAGLVLRGGVQRALALAQDAQAGLVLRGSVQQALALAQDAQVTLPATSGTGNVAGHFGHGCLPTPIPRGHVTHHYALQAGLVLRGSVQQALALAQDAQVTLPATSGTGNVAGHFGHGCLPTPIPRGHVTHHYALQAGLVLRGSVQQALALAQDAQVTLPATSGTGNVAGHFGHGCLPTPIPRGHVTHHYALQAGLVLRGSVQQALALAQDAQAQVSLWGRTARAGLALRGAGVEAWSLRLRTEWGGVTAQARAEIEPELTIAAALDFYDKPQLCVHTAVPDYTYSRNVTLESVLGDSRLLVRRSRVTSLPVPGRTLALGAPNDAACAALGAEHRD
ncbi:microsomal triacylglycerol transfer protein [Cydia amplana]|uniref:microsomal triacylglycerol transfer protein n=1 Tax=Cydia amplana TaxID=1869771 RepID=UPI002FE5A3F4